MGMTYYERFSMTQNETELIEAMKHECKVALLLGANPDRLQVIENAANRVSDERGWNSLPAKKGGDTVERDDLISRAAAIDEIGKLIKEYREDGEGEMADGMIIARRYVIKQLPAVDAVPVIHARWVKMTGMMPPEYHGHYECSNCAWHMKGLRNSWTREEELLYCPGCSAKMDGEVNA